MTPTRGRCARPHASARLLRGAVLTAGLCCALTGSAIAQGAAGGKGDQTGEAPAQPPAGTQVAPVTPVAPPEIHFRERPRYPADPQRLRRTPQIDGVLADGEWDAFYSIDDGPIKGTIYCNWDDNNLYLAARSDAPATVLFDVDMGGDGWLRGDDNLEIVVGSPITPAGQPTVTARMLDAANSKDTPSWNTTAVDPKTLAVASKIVNGVQVVEVAIPRNTASLVLRQGATIGLRAELLPPAPAAAYVPTPPFEPHLLLDAVLVDARDTATSTIAPHLTLSDYKCIPGETLFATLELRNQSDLPAPITSVLWTGRGTSENAVNTLRQVAVKPVPGMKSLKLTYKTPLPETLSVGSYMLTVTTNFADGRRVESAAAFAVVEPIQVQMSVDPQPVAIAGQTKLTASVDVMSAVPNHFRGDVQLVTVPPDWTVVGGRRHTLYIDRKDARSASRFHLLLPSNTQPGDYPLEATVTWHGRVWKARTVARVARAEAAPAPAPPKK